MNIRLGGDMQEQMAEKKQAIFESTLDLVNRNGFHGTPMSMVAKHAGVAAGTIYHYFESKEKLICELFKYVHQQVIAVLESITQTGLPYKECFFGLWFKLFTFYRENPKVLRFFEQFVNSPFNINLPSLEKDKFYVLLFSFFERGRQEGHLRQVCPKILGTMAHSSIISTAKLVAAGRLVLEQEEVKQFPMILWEGMAQK